MAGPFRTLTLAVVAGMALAGPAVAQGPDASERRHGELLPAPAPQDRHLDRAPELANKLVALSDQFIDEVKQDLGRSVQGTHLVARGQLLRSASEDFRDVLNSTTTIEQRFFAYFDVERAFRALQDDLKRPPGTTPTAGPTADRIGGVIALLGRAPFGEPPITVFPYEVSAEEILRLDRVTATIARENQQLLTFLRSFNPPNTYASVLRLHAERLADQLGAFRIRLRDSAKQFDTRRELLAVPEPVLDTPRALRLAFEPVRDAALLFQQMMAYGSLFPTAEKYWQAMRSQLREVEDTIGLTGDFGPAAEPSEGGKLRTVPGLPGPTTGSEANRHAAVMAADLALTATDAYRKILGSAPDRANLQAATRNLRDKLTSFRDAALLPTPRVALLGLLNAVNVSYERLHSEVAEQARKNPALDSFTFHELGEAIEALQKAVP